MKSNIKLWKSYSLLSLSVLTAIFSRWTWVAGFIGVKDDGSGGDNWSYKSCKAPVKSSPPTNQHPTFYSRVTFCRPTNSVRELKGRELLSSGITNYISVLLSTTQCEMFNAGGRVTRRASGLWKSHISSLKDASWEDLLGHGLTRLLWILCIICRIIVEQQQQQQQCFCEVIVLEHRDNIQRTAIKTLSVAAGSTSLCVVSCVFISSTSYLDIAVMR